MAKGAIQSQIKCGINKTKWNEMLRARTRGKEREMNRIDGTKNAARKWNQLLSHITQSP